jgi:hypothetical protein
MARVDPGPEPLSLLKPDEHQPFLDLINWIFNGGYGRFPTYTPEQRIRWMHSNLPRTYALLATNHRWSDLSDVA